MTPAPSPIAPCLLVAFDHQSRERCNTCLMGARWGFDAVGSPHVLFTNSFTLQRTNILCIRCPSPKMPSRFLKHMLLETNQSKDTKPHSFPNMYRVDFGRLRVLFLKKPCPGHVSHEVECLETSRMASRSLGYTWIYCNVLT